MARKLDFPVRVMWRSVLATAVLWAGHGALHAQSFLDALELAKNSDPKYLMARQDLISKQEDLKQAFAQLLPNASFTYSNMAIERNYIGNTTLTKANIASKNSTFSVRQPIFRKAVSASYEKSKFLLMAAEQDFISQELDLTMRTLQAYLEMLTARELIGINAAQLEVARGKLDYAEKAYQKGLAKITDVLDAKSRLSSSEADQKSIQARLALAKTALFKLTRVDWVQPWRVSFERILEHARSTASLQDWWSRIDEGSAVIKSLRAQEQAALQDVSVANAAHLPTLDGVYQQITSSNEIPLSPNTSYKDHQVGVQLSMPLFSGGGAESNVRQAQALYVKAGLQLAYQTDQLQIDAQTNFNAMQDALTRLDYNKVDLTSKSEALKASEKSYKAGLDSVLSVMQAKEQVLETQYAFVDQGGKYLQYWLKLNAASGMITPEFLADFNGYFSSMGATDMTYRALK